MSGTLSGQLVETGRGGEQIVIRQLFILSLELQFFITTSEILGEGFASHLGDFTEVVDFSKGGISDVQVFQHAVTVLCRDVAVLQRSHNLTTQRLLTRQEFIVPVISAFEQGKEHVDTHAHHEAGDESRRGGDAYSRPIADRDFYHRHHYTDQVGDH